MDEELEYDIINRYAIKTERLVARLKPGVRGYVSVFNLITLLQKLGIKI